ncbi:MAG: hypothetical protein Q7S79_01965, partial [bacterium]|nr:hypothetical protein [bacterium]
TGNTDEEIKDLTPGETETRKITAKVKAASDLPKDMSVNCDVNIAEAVSGDDRDKDTTRVCYAKQTLKVLPKAGAGVATTPLILLASLITGLFGLSIIRKSKSTL